MLNNIQLPPQAYRFGLQLKKSSPELLLVGGVLGVLTATALACKATLEAPAIIEDAKEMLDAIDKLAEIPDAYDEKEIAKAKTVTTVKATFEMVRLYSVPAFIMTVSIGALVGSNRILNGRNLALAGAYKAIDEAFLSYRRRVKDEFGEDVDVYLRYKKPHDGQMQIVDEKKKAIKFEDEETVDLIGELYDDEGDLMGMPSKYAIFFDNESPQWRTDNTMNEFFLTAQEKYANQKLQARGHVFLNEIYDALGIEHTPEGAIVGWVKGYRDDFISFDIHNPFNSFEPGPEQQQQLLLDFNVDGVIYDLI